jgi:hypothetical protein
VVQDGVLEAVQARMSRAQANAPDSLNVRPAFGPKTHRFVRRALEVGQTGPRYFLLLPLLLVGIVLLSWNDRVALWARLAAPLLITGMLLLMINLPLFYFWHHLDLLTTISKIDPEYRMSESTGQWLQVVFYLLREVMKVTARHVALGAAFLLLAGLVFVRRHQSMRRRLSSQIDTASIGELASGPIPASPTALPQDDANAASRAVH